MSKKTKLLKKAFINENDEAIEAEAYRNIDKVDLSNVSALQKTHQKIVNILDLKSVDDSMYYDFETFVKMLQYKKALKEERKQKALERKQKQVQEEEFEM